ncbi:MAG: DNA-binding response regulator [Actinobacteria bacterium]|jgi:DNA-binding NarL/FixJ family response regulator|nr:MAG: DNA-binding response regulator [Actinomycetota bacterium]
MEEAKIKVLIVDDHDIVREGLRRILESRPDIEVVAEAASGEEAVPLLERYRPNISLFDIQLPGMSGIELTARAKEINPEGEVVVLTMFDDREIATRAIKAGAIGYVLKAAANQQLLEAVDAAHRGESLITPSVARKLVELLAGLPEPKESPEQVALSEPYSQLTKREMEVLMLVAENLINRDIAERLFISEHTVKAHVKAIFRKLHIDDRTQAVIMARKDGLV